MNTTICSNAGTCKTAADCHHGQLHESSPACNHICGGASCAGSCSDDTSQNIRAISSMLNDDTEYNVAVLGRKRTCNKCLALYVGRSADGINASCILGYDVEFSLKPGPQRGYSQTVNKLKTVIPCELCPKPKTVKALEIAIKTALRPVVIH